MTKPKIKEVIVVEGRDDTAALNRAVDCITIETHGFGMSREMWKKLDMAYNSVGIIVFTDPDRAGSNIRRKILEKYPDAKEAFLSQRKAKKKDNIGVENARPEDIVEALKFATTREENTDCQITIDDFYKYGLIGSNRSKDRRIALGEALGIGYGNGKAMINKIVKFGIKKEVFEEKILEIIEKE